MTGTTLAWNLLFNNPTYVYRKVSETPTLPKPDGLGVKSETVNVGAESKLSCWYTSLLSPYYTSQAGLSNLNANHEKALIFDFLISNFKRLC